MIMIMLRYFPLFLAALFATITDASHYKSITGTAVDTDSLETLVQALTTANLAPSFDCQYSYYYYYWCTQYTVFAPTNDAFDSLPSALRKNYLKKDEYAEHLKQLLSYHVINGSLRSNGIYDGYRYRTLLQGESVTAAVSKKGVFLNGDAKVVVPDVLATNGVIHIINSVLLPPFATNDLVDALSSYNIFESLVAAVSKAGLADTLKSGKFTVFAPVEAAFAASSDALKKLNIKQLEQVLLYHVVPGIISYDSLRDGVITTVQGTTLHVTSSHSHRFSINDGASIMYSNILARDGIVHAIDHVLIPPSVQYSETITDIAKKTAALSTLVRALQATGLDEALDDRKGDFTVFAPTNRAFQMLGEGVVAKLLGDKSKLKDILKYHVLSDVRAYSSDITNSVLTTLNGANLLVHKQTGGRIQLNGKIWVETYDIKASNGVIHIIDGVLLPPENIVDTAVANNFDSLVNEVGKFSDLVSELSKGGPYTVFAPTDAAFQDVARVVKGLSEDQLKKVLQYHVVPGNIVSFTLKQGSVRTLSQKDVHINFLWRWGWNGWYWGAKVNDAYINTFNVLASNGVIHVIDQVLIPPNL
eukprot:CAMPEP_0194266134 /NCGR_PEP_ID=MMETSP0169-20130528/1142_1 /TAXON_ID=218684 /ORGANISM="Corethron pennatum, Strain L29A3" /LENGTH=586 /DNA_ID=CAMNT_0039006747 /DNA_START=23 /DNA_END=1783 /DNA_ORIENTATION=+